ncbi:methylamine utilization protein [soil metagenome]
MKHSSKLLTAAACVALGFCGIARADIKGSVKLDGKAPEMPEINMKAVTDCAKQHQDPVYEETVVVGEKGELANVIISLKPEDPSALGGEVPSEPAVIDQKGCQYVPHVLAVMVGQQMKIRNDDPFQHNVHSQASINPPFNFGQPNKDEGKAVDPPKAAETFKVKCDVHPWMGAWVAVFDHPFFAVSGEDGKFDIKGKVPEGEYTIVAWHEKYGTQEGKVKIDGEGNGTVDFTFKAEGATGPDNIGQPKLASARTEGAASSMSCCSEGEKPKAKATASTK